MIYLDNAATSFIKPTCVHSAMVQAMVKHSANPGRGGHSASVSANEILYETRESLAKLFGVENPTRIVFAQNTTHALNMALKGTLSYGDHVIFTSMEHNSVVRPIETLKQDKRLSTSVLWGDANGTIAVDKLEKMIRPHTKLICMTHSSNVCGTVNDVYRAAEIAKKRGVLFLVDCAQSAGVLPLDFSKFDMAAFPGHKGLMAPMGTGGLYVREGLFLHTFMEGGTGSLSEQLTQPDIMPDRLESGTQNVPAIAGMGAAAEFLLKTGIDTVRAHEMTLCRRFEEGVRTMAGVTVYGGGEKTAVCALNIEGKDCVEVAQILNDRYHIAVRAGLHCAYLAHKTLGTEKTGCVRFSFGYFNTEQEVDLALNAINDIVNDVLISK